MSEEQLDIPIGVDLTPFRNAMAQVRSQVLSVPKVRVDHSQEIDALKTASKRVTAEAKTATQAVGKIAGANSLRELTGSAHQTWRAMSNVSTELTVTQAKMERVSIAASILTGNFGALTTQTTAMGAQVTRQFGGISRGLAFLKGGIRAIGVVASHAYSVFAAANAVVTPVLVYAAAALKVMTVALIVWEGAMLTASGVLKVFTALTRAIVAPLKFVASALIALGKLVWGLVAPFARVAAAVYGFWIQLKATGLAIQWTAKLFGMLPPKVKATVAALFSVGLAARTLGPVMRLLGPAAAVATAGLKMLALPIVALINPSVASAMALGMLRGGMLGLSKAAALSVGALRNFAVAAAKASVSVAGGIAGTVLTMASSALKTFGTIAIASTGWGIKLAADAEQAEIAFTTMLKSASGAKAVLAELEQFAASTPFQLKDLRDGAKQLLNAGVPADQLTAKLTALGDIAAGTGKPINDFVRIFAKVKSTGKVSLETLNQLAERGVPIYSALQSQLGKSRTEMLKMISKGKIGFSDMNAALNTMATGSGVFAGGMKAQSQSISGLFSTLKDNVGFAMRELGIEVMNAFNFKAMLADGINLFQSLKAGITAARPAFVATADVVRTAIGAIWEVASVAFNSITSALGITSGDWLKTFVTMAAVASFSFKNWPNLAQLAFTKVTLWLVQAGENFNHLFTGVIGGLLTWFAGSWKDIWFTADDLVMSVFVNIGKNIRNAMTEIWSFIASKGMEPLKLTWTPLLDGFKNTISELPGIPPRTISQLEKQLMADSERLGSALTTNLESEIEKNLDMLSEFRSRKIETPTLDGIKAQTDSPIESTPEVSRRPSLIESLDRGSEAALNAIFAAQQDQRVDKQLAEAKKQTEQLKAIAAKEPVKLAVAGGVA